MYMYCNKCFKLTSPVEKDEDEGDESIKKEDVSDGKLEATEEEDKTPVKRPKARRKGSRRSSKGKGSKAKADNKSSSKPDIKMEETDNDLSQAEGFVESDMTSSKTEEESSKTEALVKRGSEIEMSSSDLAAAGGGAVASTSVKSEATSSADEGQDKDEATVKTSSQ